MDKCKFFNQLIWATEGKTNRAFVVDYHNPSTVTMRKNIILDSHLIAQMQSKNPNICDSCYRNLTTISGTDEIRLSQVPTNPNYTSIRDSNDQLVGYMIQDVVGTSQNKVRSKNKYKNKSNKSKNKSNKSKSNKSKSNKSKSNKSRSRSRARSRSRSRSRSK